MEDHKKRIDALLESLKFESILVFFPDEANDRTLIVIWNANAELNQMEALIARLEQDYDFEKVDVACSLLNTYIQCW